MQPVRQSKVASAATGRVDQILVREGQRVAANQAVLVLEDDTVANQLADAELSVQTARINLEKAQAGQSGNVATLEAQVRSAALALEVARNKFQEGQQLYPAGGIAKLDLDNLEAQVAQARSSLESAQEQLARAQRANTEDIALLRVQLEQAQNKVVNARKALADTRVRAPFAGVISDVRVNPGEFLSSGAEAFTLADTSALEATFRLPPEQAGAITSDTPLVIAYGGKNYRARLVRRGTLPGEDRLVELVARVASSDLPVGGTATLRYSLELGEGTLLPAGALRTQGGKTEVLTVQGGNRAEPLGVQILAESEGRVVVSGLEAGTQVVYPLPTELAGGELLEVVK
nr:HlyD family efflux transporter periplasmic adaptor subunit [Deinobacterium chartae]